MPALQTTYNETPAVAFAGMRANMEPHTVVSRTVGSGTLSFGSVACHGAADDQVVSASGAAFMGIALADVTVPATLSGQLDEYVAGRTAAIMTKGVVWVIVSGTVSAGAPAFFDPANGHIVADNTKTAINGTFDTSGSAGALVKLRLN